MGPYTALEQDDPAGEYVDIEIDAAYAGSSDLRSGGVVARNATLGREFFASAEMIDTLEDGVLTILSGFAVAEGDYDEADGWKFHEPLLSFTREITPGEEINKDAATITPVKPPFHGEYRVAHGATSLVGEAIKFGLLEPPLVSKNGNALFCAFAYEDTDAETSISSVVLGNDSTPFTHVETISTTDGTKTYKLATYLLANQPATNPLVALPVIVATFSAPTSGDGTVVGGCVEVRNCATSPADVSVSASGDDALPTTAASADTATANELVGAFLFASGAAFDPSALPTDPADFTAISDGYTGDSVATDGAISLYFYRRNVTEITNIGFACTLPEARAWAVGAYSFK